MPRLSRPGQSAPPLPGRHTLCRSPAPTRTRLQESAGTFRTPTVGVASGRLPRGRARGSTPARIARAPRSRRANPPPSPPPASARIQRSRSDRTTGRPAARAALRSRVARTDSGHGLASGSPRPGTPGESARRFPHPSWSTRRRRATPARGRRVDDREHSRGRGQRPARSRCPRNLGAHPLGDRRRPTSAGRTRHACSPAASAMTPRPEGDDSRPVETGSESPDLNRDGGVNASSRAGRRQIPRRQKRPRAHPRRTRTASTRPFDRSPH